MSTDQNNITIVAVNGAKVELSVTFGHDDQRLSKTFSFWLMVIGEGILAKKVKRPLSALLEEIADDLSDPPCEVSKATEKHAMKFLREIVFGKVEGGKGKDHPRYLEAKVPEASPRPVVSVTLVLRNEAHAKSFKQGAKWGCTCHDYGINEPPFAYDADDWDSDDEEDE